MSTRTQTVLAALGGFLVVAAMILSVSAFRALFLDGQDAGKPPHTVAPAKCVPTPNSTLVPPITLDPALEAVSAETRNLRDLLHVLGGEDYNADTRAALDAWASRDACSPGPWDGAIVAAVKALAAAQDQLAADTIAARSRPAARVSGGGGSGGTCSGSIPGYIIYCESKCNPLAQNGQYTGKYQASPTAWGGYGGYAQASDAPESVQDQWAAEAWATRGPSAWSCA